MQLFYASDIDSSSSAYTFDREESRHIGKVLRKNEGDPIKITDGKGSLYHGIITELTSRHCRVTIERVEQRTHRRYHLHMAVAPTKSNDRFEWFLEKATEIGIDEITPIYCEHSERKVIKPERLEKILQSAMKQSLNCFLPILNPAISFKEFLASEHPKQRFIAHCYPQERAELKRKVLADNPVLLLIGPEGDFSEEEVSHAKNAGFTPVSLGDSRLRTETAALVACHTVALINQY